MYDSQAFESQVQAAYHQWAREMSTDVDALTFVRETRAAATRGRRQWPWVRARLGGDSAPPRSVTRLPAAGLIAVVAAIAIGAGALIVVGGQSPSMAPAWTPPPGLVKEGIAPGIALVTSDGSGHTLALGDRGDVAFAPDGSIWVLGPGGMSRIGHDGTSPTPRTTVHFPDLTAGPDGTLWALANDTVASFRQGNWVDAPPFPGGSPAKALEVLPDGEVWARSTTTLARLDGDDWTAFAIQGSAGPIPDYGHVFPGDLAWTRDGSFWLTVCEGDDGGNLLLRFARETWTAVAIPGARDDVRCVLPLATGPGGSLWVYLVQDTPAVAVYDGEAWRVSPDDAAIPSVAGPGGYVGAMVVGHDGRLWAIGPGGEGHGDLLGVYDGTTWSDVYVSESTNTTLIEHPLKVAPDGTIWLQMDNGFLVVTP